MNGQFVLGALGVSILCAVLFFILPVPFLRILLGIALSLAAQQLLRLQPQLCENFSALP